MVIPIPRRSVVYGWYKNRVGKSRREATVFCNSWGLERNGERYVVKLEAVTRRLVDDDDNTVVDSEKLVMELTPQQARALAEELYEATAALEASTR